MPTRETRSLARRRVIRRRQIIRRRRQVVWGVMLFFCGLLVLAGFQLAAALSNRPAAKLSAPQAHASSASTPSKSSSTAPAPTTPVRSTGEYSRAPGGTDRHGPGKLVTYRVEVETGTGQGASAFAAAVDATLADPASWTGRGRWSLRRVAGRDADLVIRLATSGTVGEVCEAAGLEDAAYASCQTGRFVMINLDRWLYAVPEYGGDVALYRQYVINHEVGHGLGFSHQACPGPGRPAPVMQQQTLALDGCLPNGWPYVAGKFVSGPAIN